MLIIRHLLLQLKNSVVVDHTTLCSVLLRIEIILNLDALLN
jgi:hypothetical protein